MVDDAYLKYKNETVAEIKNQGLDSEFCTVSRRWMQLAEQHKYTYHFEWMGRPVIQYPQDLLIMQTLVWKIQPDLIIETGIAHGGSLVYYASLLELNAIMGGPENAQVLGIDIDIRPHNKAALLGHPLVQRRVTLFEGSSVEMPAVREAQKLAQRSTCVLVCLDSMHTHEHVLAELRHYTPLVSVGSYCVVFDTSVEFSDLKNDRPWGKGNSPLSAVHSFLEITPNFVQDNHLDNTAMISECPGGYLKRIL